MSVTASPSIEKQSAGSFTGGAFSPTPAGQLLLDYLQDKFGVPLEVQRSSSPSQGYFDARGGEKGYGGTLDKSRRVVFLNPESADIHTLAHEAGHAYDPSLVKMYQDEAFLTNRANPIAAFTYGRDVEPKDASDFLNAFLYASPSHTRLTSEALAQKEANESLRAIGVDNPKLNDTWYREYPAAHVESSLDKAYALMANPYTPGTSARDEYIRNTFNTPTLFDPPDAPSMRLLDDATQWDMRDAVTKKYLNLGLNPDLTEATRKVQGRTEAYLDRMLPDAKKSEYTFNFGSDFRF